jgi:hypothetical protein
VIISAEQQIYGAISFSNCIEKNDDENKFHNYRVWQGCYEDDYYHYLQQQKQQKQQQ